MSINRQASHGFTLLELLISITVFAIMSVMAYGGLSNVIDNSKSSKQALSRLQQVQHTMFNIERDFSQIAKRDIRDEYGEVKKYVTAGDDIDQLIELTRSGRRNPAKILRSNLLRVAYKIDDGKLTRLYWPQLDRAQGMIPYETILLTNVASAELRFLDTKSKWHSQWPPLDTTSPAAALNAIEYKIILDDWGEISRLFTVQS